MCFIRCLYITIPAIMKQPIWIEAVFIVKRTLNAKKPNVRIDLSECGFIITTTEKEYKRKKNKLTDVSDSRADGLTTSADSLLVRNWQDILAIYVYEQSQEGNTEFTLDSSAKDELARSLLR